MNEGARDGTPLDQKRGIICYKLKPRTVEGMWRLCLVILLWSSCGPILEPAGMCHFSICLSIFMITRNFRIFSYYRSFKVFTVSVTFLRLVDFFRFSSHLWTQRVSRETGFGWTGWKYVPSATVNAHLLSCIRAVPQYTCRVGIAYSNLSYAYVGLQIQSLSALCRACEHLNTQTLHGRRLFAEINDTPEVTHVTESHASLSEKG